MLSALGKLRQIPYLPVEWQGKPIRKLYLIHVVSIIICSYETKEEESIQPQRKGWGNFLEVAIWTES